MIGECNVVLELHLLLSLNMMSSVMALSLMFLNLDFHGIKFKRLILYDGYLLQEKSNHRRVIWDSTRHSEHNS